MVVGMSTSLCPSVNHDEDVEVHPGMSTICCEEGYALSLQRGTSSHKCKRIGNFYTNYKTMKVVCTEAPAEEKQWARNCVGGRGAAFQSRTRPQSGSYDCSNAWIKHNSNMKYDMNYMKFMTGMLHLSSVSAYVGE